jgi:hypothetical protein
MLLRLHPMSHWVSSFKQVIRCRQSLTAGSELRQGSIRLGLLSEKEPANQWVSKSAVSVSVSGTSPLISGNSGFVVGGA